MAPYSDSAVSRVLRSANVVAIMANAFGAARAAPTPCRARAAISMPVFRPRPPASDATTKTAIPSCRVRRRPHTSPSRPPSSSSAPKARM